MKQDKFLIGILVFIGLLVVAALALFFVRGQSQAEIPDDTPEGVVYNYILALQQQDYETAYSYLSARHGRPSLAAFESNFRQNSYLDLETYAVEVTDTSILGDTALVEFVATRVATDPFSEEWDENYTARLVLQSGNWKIESMPYPFWGWNWYTR